MTIPVQCPTCDAQYSLDEADAGQHVECACGQLLFVPEVPSEQKPAAFVIACQCPACSAQYKLEVELAGQRVECQCGQRLLVPSAETAQEEHAPVVKTDTQPAKPVQEQRPRSDVEHPETKSKPAKSESNSRSKPDTDTKTQRSRKQKSSQRTQRLIGSAVVGGIALLGGLYMLTRSDPSESQEKLAVTTTATKQKPIVQPTPDAAKATQEPTTPPRKSLAQRLNADKPRSTVANAETTNQSPQTGSVVKANGNEPNTKPGSSNPHADTNKDQFVNLSPTAKAKARGSKAGKPTSATEVKPGKAKLQKPAKTTKPPAAKTPATTPKQSDKRIAFVTSKRNFRGFERAAKESLQQFAKLQTLKQKSLSGKRADIDAWKQQLAVTGGLLRATQREQTNDSDPILAARMRLLLAWCYLESNQLYEAGIVSLEIARRTPKDMVIEPPQPPKPKERSKAKAPEKAAPQSVGASLIDAELAKSTNNKKSDEGAFGAQRRIQPKKEATLMALTAFSKAWEQATPSDRNVEYQAIVRAAEILHSNWPKHPKANDIRLHVAQLHNIHKSPENAATWYLRVSQKSPEYARAQLTCGQIFHSQFVAVAKQESATEDVIDDFKQKARQYLRKGISLAVEKPDLRDNVYLAKLSLAQMELRDKNYTQALEDLTSTPLPLTKAVAVAKNSQRPETGIKSQRFANAVFDTLVRVHLENQNTSAAIKAMDELEKTGGEMTAGTAKLYVPIAEKLATEYHATVADGHHDPESLTNVAEVLQKISDHAEQLPPATLKNAATLTSDLAQKVNVKEDAEFLYQISVKMYQSLVESAPEQNQRSLRYQMAIAMGPAGQNQQAFEVFEQMLKVKPNVFDVQFAAARTLQAWGTTGHDTDRLRSAINGITDKPHVWGWRKLARTLQKLMAKDDAKPNYATRFLDAQNSIAECRIQLAVEMPDQSQRQAELEKAATEIRLLALQTTDDHRDNWKQLEATYLKIHSQLGRKASPLFE